MGVRIESLQAEHHESGFGIDVPAPRLSWRFAQSDEVDWRQAGYEIEIVQGGQAEKYEVKGEDSVLVPWPGKRLVSRERVEAKVRAEGVDGQFTNWVSMWIEAGLFGQDDWVAKAVGGPRLGGEKGPLRPVRVCTRFLWEGEIKTARLYATAYGIYTAYLNGKRIGDQLLTPGWTSYKHNHRYQIYDVSSLLKPGSNILSAEIGEGWWAGRLGLPGVGCLFGDRLGFMGQLEVDGVKVVATDADWEWSTFEIELSQVYDGEILDATLIKHDWWKEPVSRGKVDVLPFPAGKLQISDAPPVRRIQERKAVELIQTPSGATILDFGQNIVGWLRIERDLPGDGEMVIRHAEVLENGELGVRPLRTAKAEVRIKLGGPTKGYEPRFTWFGFRYAEITGVPVHKDDYTAIAISSDMRRTGHFSCSHELVNRLYENVVWSTIDNFISLPTDCPQRDERLGWTGDLQVFAKTANYLFDTSGFLEGWLRDVSSETLEYDGVCPEMVPWIYEPYQPGRKMRRMGIWADCTALTPWDLYTYSGDEEVLCKNWDSMTAWLDKGVPRGENGLYSHDQAQFGDWLDPRAPPSLPGHGQTNPYLATDAFLVHTTRTVARIACILGKPEAERYADDYARLFHTFQEEYITRTGRMVSDTQTALALALKFDLFPDDCKARGISQLEYLVKWDAFRIATGFAGTPIILPALAENGLLHCAYRMLQEGENPSWLYPVTMGATTIWERWDSMLPDGSINPGTMTSFNHYALGSVAHFLHSVVGGLSPSSSLDPSSGTPGWKQAIIKPQPGGTITHAQTSYESPYGTFKCAWKIAGDRLKIDITVPPNATARVILPGDEHNEAILGSGSRSFEVKWKQDPRWPPKAKEAASQSRPKDQFLP